jgi:hypothetical protein
MLKQDLEPVKEPQVRAGRDLTFLVCFDDAGLHLLHLPVWRFTKNCWLSLSIDLASMSNSMNQDTLFIFQGLTSFACENCLMLIQEPLAKGFAEHESFIRIANHFQ